MSERVTLSMDKLTPMQSWAYEVANESYHVPNHEAVMATAIELYKEDMHEKIVTLFEYSDSQNAVIDAGLKQNAKEQKEPEPMPV